MKKYLVFALVLAGCGTAQEQCINRNTRDLRVIGSLIAETEANLARGYAIREETHVRPSFEPCMRPARATKDNPRPRPILTHCRTTESYTTTRPEAIDLQAETAKLQQLIERRDILRKQAQHVISYCQASYPEAG